MDKVKSAYTQLTLSFRTENTVKFEEFISFTTTRAGANIDPEMVQRIKTNNHTKYVITASPENIYMFGYDWALWQFPPTK